MKTFTSTSLAKELGVCSSYVRNLAARMRLGEMLNPRLRTLSAGDARKIRAAIKRLSVTKD